MIIKHETSSVWGFNNLDPVNQSAYWQGGFNEEDCKKIIEIGNTRCLEKGLVGDNNLSKIRNCEVSWLFPNTETEWIYRRMTDIILSLNDKHFKFDIYGAIEGIQFTKYTAPSGDYGKHIDSAFGYTIRKLSFVLQLSNPEDYKGGELLLHFSNEPYAIKKELGFVTVFPSYMLHEVTSVTEGTRYSLVAWITGKPFK